jgi:hypothetical protein
VLTIAGMGLSVLGFEQAATWGWDNPGTWLCIVGGLAVLAFFVRLEARTEYPLIRVQVFRDRAFVIDNAVLFLSMIAFVPIFFFASVYSQVSLGYDASDAGLYLLVFFAGFAPGGPGRRPDAGRRRGRRAGGARLRGGHGRVRPVGLEDHRPQPQRAVALRGHRRRRARPAAGPASTDAVNRAIGASYGEVTGITQTVRNYASALGIAVLGTALTTVLTHRLTTSFTGLGLPASAAEAAANGSVGQSSGGVPASVPARLREAIQSAVAADFAVATRAVLIGMAIALGAAFLVSLAHPWPACTGGTHQSGGGAGRRGTGGLSRDCAT